MTGNFKSVKSGEAVWTHTDLNSDISGSNFQAASAYGVPPENSLYSDLYA